MGIFPELSGSFWRKTQTRATLRHLPQTVFVCLFVCLFVCHFSCRANTVSTVLGFLTYLYISHRIKKDVLQISTISYTGYTPKFNSSLLKIDGWKEDDPASYWGPVTFGGRTVKISGGGGGVPFFGGEISWRGSLPETNRFAPENWCLEFLGKAILVSGRVSWSGFIIPHALAAMLPASAPVSVLPSCAFTDMGRGWLHQMPSGGSNAKHAFWNTRGWGGWECWMWDSWF